MNTKLVPIRTVCAMYGINPNTLRTWERRYSLVQPKTSAGGHRGYSEGDVAVIGAMVAQLSDGVSPAEAAERARSLHVDESRQPDTFAIVRRDLRKAIRAFSAADGLRLANQAVSEAGYQAVVESLLFPELTYWGENWQQPGGIAREHVASLIVRSVMIAQQIEVLSKAAGPTVILACAPGEAHDLPMLHVSNLICASGEFTPIVLVAGLPIEQILQAADSAKAIVLVISATIPPASSATREWLSMIISSGWEERTILVGGGFNRSRVFSESKVRSAPGSYEGVIDALRRIGN